MIPVRRVDPGKLAGVEGFEPPNGGIKTRCLTAWRHPSVIVSERLRPASPRAARARAGATDSDPAPGILASAPAAAPASLVRCVHPASLRIRTTPYRSAAPV